MPEHDEIYNQHADLYEALVSREDYEGNILRALNAITPFAGKQVVELGAGTGRLTCMVAPTVASIRAYDASQHMLDVAAAKLASMDGRSWQATVADHRDIPIEDDQADIVIAGWSICYLVTWNPDGWRPELDRALAEMTRISKPGGTIIILETQGTGNETPAAPDFLVDYYTHLEAHGFDSTWIRTDYRFADRAEAEHLAGFFFGEEMLDKIVEDTRGITLPECTGLWWQHLSTSAG